MHFALMLCGDAIYSPSELPDYDFYSNQSIETAYELADLLAKKGFAFVDSIPAIHGSTQRVRSNFLDAADVSYMSEGLLRRIPKLDYNGIKIAHPIWMRMDMHRSFCFPLGGVPREDVFHRFPKNIKRFNLSEKYYPLNKFCKENDIILPKIGVDILEHMPMYAEGSLPEPIESLVAEGDVAVTGVDSLRVNGIVLHTDDLFDGQTDGQTDGADIGAAILAITPNVKLAHKRLLDSGWKLIESRHMFGSIPKRTVWTPPPKATTQPKRNLVLLECPGHRPAVVREHGMTFATIQVSLMFFLGEYFRTQKVGFLAIYRSIMNVVQNQEEQAQKIHTTAFGEFAKSFMGLPVTVMKCKEADPQQERNDENLMRMLGILEPVAAGPVSKPKRYYLKGDLSKLGPEKWPKIPSYDLDLFQSDGGEKSATQ